jgi:hypothetical protein
MSEPTDGALSYWKDHREQMRQSESQRATLTNYLLAIVAALSALIAQQKFALTTLPLAVMIMAVGLYGAITTAKYHERAAYHLSQARALTRLLVEAGALLDVDQTLQEFRDRHTAKYSRLHRIRLHQLWTGLHLGIAAYGLTLTIIVAAHQ